MISASILFRDRRPKLLFADVSGRVYEHPTLWAAVWDGREIMPAARCDWAPLDSDGALLLLPGRLPVGWDSTVNRSETLDRIRMGRRIIRPMAVAAVPAMGWTRIHLPAYCRAPRAPVLPLYAYTAAAGLDGQIAVAAVRTDRHRHWDGRLFNGPDLVRRIRDLRAARPGNQVLAQLARCSLEYRCRTAQNIFFQRWEGGLPVSPACNARCVGCLSNQPAGSLVCAAHHRLTRAPDLEDLVAVMADHVIRATRPVVSFGQGCEGEPTLQADLIEQAIRRVRRLTRRGRFHLNTNGSRPDAIARLARVGLQSIRIALNSARAEVYHAYFRPRDYNFDTVRESIRLSVRLGLRTALNLLVFPGVSDQVDEAEAFIELLKETKPHAVQWRSLGMDPDRYLACLPPVARIGPCLGLRAFLRLVRTRCPWLQTGNFNPLPS